MKLTPETFAAATWGTGYGSARHLIDRDRSRIRVKGGGGTVRDMVQARCTSDGRPVFLDFFDSTADREQVMRKRECKRCVKLAADEVVSGER